jgi:hypothetical protein
MIQKKNDKKNSNSNRTRDNGFAYKGPGVRDKLIHHNRVEQEKAGKDGLQQ